MRKSYQSAQSNEVEAERPRGGSHGVISVPVSMVAALAAGLAFALGHHFFYHSLDGHLVAEMISQNWAIRLGTGAAFLVRLFFAIASSIAYVQRQWVILNKTRFKLSQLDSMTGILDNALYFAHVTLWARSPLLAIMAGVTWLLSFAVVFTPSTLSVITSQRTQLVPTNVAEYNFNSQYYDLVPSQTGGILPTQNLVRIGFATGVIGDILSLPMPYQNASYRLQFYGPSLTCSRVNDPAANALLAGARNTNFTNSYLTFAAWVPGDPNLFDDTSSILSPSQRVDLTSTDVSRLYILTSPYPPLNTTTSTLNITECQLFNTSYLVEFTSEYPILTTTVLSLSRLNPISFSNTSATTTTTQHTAYQSLTYTFNQLLVGTITQDRRTVRQTQQFTKWAYLDHDIVTFQSAPSKTPEDTFSLLFQNITLSTLNDEAFRKPLNQSSPVNVQVTSYPTTYTYHPEDLYLAYGLSFVAAALCTLVGMYALTENRGIAYSNQFSTYVQMASVVVADPDASPKPRQRGIAPGWPGTSTGRRGNASDRGRRREDDNGTEMSTMVVEAEEETGFLNGERPRKW